GDARGVDRGHFRAQVLRQITDGIQFGVARFAAGLEVSDLRNRAAAQHPNAQQARFFSHLSGYRCRNAVCKAVSFCRCANATKAGKCFSEGTPFSSPARWTSSACIMASAPRVGSGLPCSFLIELMAEPARNRTFSVRPRFSAS